MAITYTPAGNVSFSISVNGAVTTGTQVLNSYNIPVAASPVVSIVYAGGTGTLAVTKLIQLSGTLTSGATTGSAVVALNGATPTADIVGTTATWTSVREIIVFNDGPTGFTSGNTSLADVVWDMSTGVTTSAWGASTTSGYNPVSVAAMLTTGPKITIPPGSWQKFSKPFQTSGWTVDATNYSIILAASATNNTTTSYRVIVMGS